MVDPDKYLKRFSIFSPSYTVNKIAGQQIRDQASKYFSGKMIEVGCGTKIKHLLIGDLIDEHIGLDHKDCPHDQSNIDIFGTAYDIPSENEEYDCLLSTAVLEHLEEPKVALTEAFRVLKIGGYAIYTIPLFWHLHEEPRDFYRYTKYGLRYLFESAGFEIIEMTAMSGFWITFGTELNYYLMRFRRNVLKPFISGFIALSNLMMPQLDKGFLRDEKFTWMYIVVVKKTISDGKKNNSETANRVTK